MNSYQILAIILLAGLGVVVCQLLKFCVSAVFGRNATRADWIIGAFVIALAMVGFGIMVATVMNPT
jgi:hypothetical protein